MWGSFRKPLRVIAVTAMAAVVLFSLNQLSNTQASTFDPSTAIALSDTTPAANPDHITSFVVPVGDANFAGSGAALVTFLPNGWCIATHDNDCSSTTGVTPGGPAVPKGAVVGDLTSTTKLALQTVGGSFNGTCNQTFPVAFTFFEAVPDNNDTGETQRTGETAPAGEVSTSGISNVYQVLTDDADGDGIPNHADMWPSFNTTLLDPDGPGGAGPVFPIARYSSDTIVSTTDVILQLLVFAPGALTAFPGEPWAQMTAALGYPTLTILQDPQQENNTSIADFCTSLVSETTILGVTTDNGAVTGNQAGFVLHKNAAALAGIGNTGTHIYQQRAQSERDPDNDGIENGFDTCPFTTNTDGDPRVINGPDLDGVDSACDPRPGSLTQFDPTAAEDGGAMGTCGNGIDDGSVDGADINDVDDCHVASTTTTGGLDIDNDGWANRLDNCPLVANGSGPTAQEDNDIVFGTAAVADNGPNIDQIGNACDPNPTTPDGHFHNEVRKAFACNGAADSDGDGWCDDVETGFANTDPNNACPVNTADDALPPDVNNDTFVNLFDRSVVVFDINNAVYTARYDVNNDGFLNLFDRTAVVQSNGFSC